MLIKIFTRTKSNDQIFDGNRNLKQWVNHSLSPAVMEVVDASLIMSSHDEKVRLCTIHLVALLVDIGNYTPTASS